MSSRALLFGYNTLGLKYIDNDLETIANAFEKNDIEVTTPKDVLENKKKKGLVATLDDFFDSKGSSDTVIVYFSGHAFAPKGDLLLVIDDNIQQVNSSTISLSYITSLIDNCDAKNKLLVLDCCHALSGVLEWRPPQSESYRVLAASGRFEKAKEIEQFQASYLSYQIGLALTKYASEVVGPRNEITINRLFEWIKRQTLDYNNQNIDPVPIPKLIGDQGRDFDICKISGHLIPYQIKKYLENIDSCFSNCKKECFGRYPWCRSAFEIGNNIRHYVVPTIRFSDNNNLLNEKLTKHFMSWILSTDKCHLAILGDSGVGKSSACLYLSLILAKKCLANTTHRLIPIYISLEYLSRSNLLGSEISKILREHLHINTTDETIYELVRKGYFVFFLDGFDEISDRSNHSKIIHNLRQLGPIFLSGCKVILTCRTHFFVNQEQLDEVLLGNANTGTELYAALKKQDANFTIVELQEFTEIEIRSLISKMYTDDSGQILDKIKSIYNLEDLSKRPMLLILILKTLSLLQQLNNTPNRADIYDAYTEFWLRREAERVETNIDIKKKASFMESISVEMWRLNVISIHYKKLNSEIQYKYGTEIKSSRDIQSIDYDTRNASFLNRDQSGYYKFMHKSFQEFFVSKRAVKELRVDGKGMNSWKYKWFDKEVAAFISDMLQREKFSPKIKTISEIVLKKIHRIMLWNALHILSLISADFFNKFTENQIIDRMVTHAEKEQEAVILRQYCRIIAKFGNQQKAKDLIHRTVEIVTNNQLQNFGNNKTYINYYYGISSACDALLNHLDTISPKYDQELHIYVLGELGNIIHSNRLKKIMGFWQDQSQLDNALMAIKKMEKNQSAIITEEG